MRYTVFSYIFVLSAICSFVVNGIALSEEKEVKEATEVQTEMLDEQSDEEVRDENLGKESDKSQQSEYIVKKGDTLSEIAENTLGSEDKWPLIAKINNLSNPDEIFVGQKLKLPADLGTQDTKVDEYESEAGLNENPVYQPDSDITGSDESDMKAKEVLSAAEDYVENTITGRIESSETGSDTLIITDENGNSHEFKLSNSDVLDGVQQGDTVEIEFQNGVAVSVVHKDVSAGQGQINN